MDAEARLTDFLDKFTPDIAARATAAIARMRALLPGAQVLVYDNYNALAVAFGATQKQADFVCSIAVYPRWVSLFLVGPHFDDPHDLLRGSGATMRHVVLEHVDMLDEPRVRALLDQALAHANQPMPAAGGHVVVKSVSAKQRPRRPGM